MKPINEMLDADTNKNWINVQNALTIMATNEGKLGELGVIMSRMLQEFSDSYEKYDMVPPGIKATLAVMLPLSLCTDDDMLKNTLANAELHSHLQTAMNEVDSVKSGLNYVMAGLKFIAALVLTLVIAPVVFLLSAVLGILAGSPIPYVGMLMLTPLAAIPTFYTYRTGKDLLMHGIHQIQRTGHENGTEGKIMQQMGLFRDALNNNPPPEPPANLPTQTV